ncbi:MAG: hypothetical protein AAFV80_13510 [Bacteroidota bacterium]
MKQRFALILIAFSCFTFTGCIEYIETLKLNKNGSGNYSMRIDMSGIMKDAFMKSMIEQSLEENELDLRNGQESLEMDSTTTFSDLPADVQAQFDEYPGVLDRLTLRIKISESDEALFLDFNLDFEQFEEIDYVFNNMEKILASGDDMPGSEVLDMMPGMGKDGLFKLSKGTLTRFSSQTDPSAMGISKDDLEMVKMMLGEATFTSIYTFPGKVKKVSHENSVISTDKKTVTTEVSYIDLLEGKANIDNMIKFKGK